MDTLKALINEILGMFVDDGSLAFVILAVVAVAAWVSVRFENDHAAIGTILFVGCLAALIENIVRTVCKARGS